MKRLMLSCLLFVLPFGVFAGTEQDLKTLNAKLKEKSNCLIGSQQKAWISKFEKQGLNVKYEEVAENNAKYGCFCEVTEKSNQKDGASVSTTSSNKSNFAKDLISNHKKALKVTGGVVAGLGLAAGGYYLHTSGKAAQAWDASKPYVNAGLEKAGVWCGQLKDLAVAAGSSLKEAIQAKLSK